MSFLRGQVDKLILLSILTLMVVVIFHSPDHALWAEQTFKEVLAALLILLTGRAIARASDNNGKP